MKRFLIIFSITVLIIVSTLFFLRHAIIGHALSISISKKTNQTITLNIGHVYYSVINSSVSFTDSKFLFNNTYLNKEKTIELSELKFDKIKLENFSLLRLIFKHEVIASRFSVAAPSLWFNENNSPQPTKENPKKIIKSLKEHPDLLGNLIIKVDEIEITNGKIDINSLFDNEEHNGSVEFKFLLKNFNTSKEQIFNEGRVLFAEEYFVKLSDFNYTLSNGDQISFDSTVFKSNTNTLVLSNIRVKSSSFVSEIGTTVAEVRELLIEGIDLEEIEKLHDVDIDSISISDVFLYLTKNDSVMPKFVSDTSMHKHKILSLFNSLNLASFTLNNFNVMSQSVDGDTIIDGENMNFSVANIQLDSASIMSEKPNIDYESINMSSGELKVFDEKSGLRISLADLVFDEEEGVMSIADVRINDKKPEGTQLVSSNIDSLALSGVSLESLITGQPMKLGVFISKPIVDIDISHDFKHNGTKKNIALDKFVINKIQVSNGVIHLFNDKKLDVSVTGLDINSGRIYLNDFNKINEIITNELALFTSSVIVQMPEKQMSFSLDSLSLLKSDLTIYNAFGNMVDDARINSSIFVKQLQFGGTDIEKIILDKEIGLKYIKIVKPRIYGSLNLNSDNKNLNKQPVNIFNYKLKIDDFELTKGSIDLDLNVKQDALKFKSEVDITVDNIDIPDMNDISWVNKLLWKIKLSQIVIAYQNYQIRCNKFVSDKNKEFLFIEDIEISDNANKNEKTEIDIREFSIKSIELVGLNYDSILEKRTPVVRTISVSNPHVELKINSRNEKSTGDSKLSRSKIGFPFDVNEFIINDLSFKVEKEDSISISNFSLNNIDFKYNMSEYENVISGVEYFDASGFLFSDTIKNSFVSIEKFSFNRENQGIGISDIRGGSIYKGLESDNYLSYSSSGFDIVGIDLSYASPHNISIQDINIDNFQLDVENHKKMTTSGSSVKKKKKLPDFISGLDINNISASNVDIEHVTVSDTSVKKLTLNKLGFEIDAVKIDSNTFLNSNFAFAEQVSVNINDNKFVSSDSLYETSINSISYNFKENVLSVDLLMMKPRYESAEFFKKAVYQTGKMDIVTGSIVCSNFRLDKLLHDDAIHIGAVDVYGLDMRIFRNKKYEMNPKMYKKMPQEALLDLSKIITIDSLKTHDAYIQYRQLSEKSIVPGEIFLNEANLSAFNINNNLQVIDEKSVMLVFFDAKLIGESPMNLKITFPILSPAHDFWVTGNVDKIDFTKLNSMTQNLVGVTMAKGTGELAIPLISGNSEYSIGSVLFKYRKLKIELFDRDKAENTTGLVGSMAKLLLNDIFIKSNNPGFLGKTRSGEVYFKRNTQKSVVYYTWKSVLSGIMSTMGYNNKEQRQEKRAYRRKRK